MVNQNHIHLTESSKTWRTESVNSSHLLPSHQQLRSCVSILNFARKGTESIPNAGAPSILTGLGLEKKLTSKWPFHDWLTHLHYIVHDSYLYIYISIKKICWFFDFYSFIMLIWCAKQRCFLYQTSRAPVAMYPHNSWKEACNLVGI